jgi:putative transcriptional regulator
MTSNLLTAAEIKEMRPKTGLTQKEFCTKHGLNLRTYQGWESGRRAASLTVCLLLRVIEKFPKHAMEQPPSPDDLFPLAG